MDKNLPVLLLDEVVLLPSMELRMDFDNSVDKKIFSISDVITIAVAVPTDGGGGGSDLAHGQIIRRHHTVGGRVSECGLGDELLRGCV